MRLPSSTGNGRYTRRFASILITATLLFIAAASALPPQPALAAGFTVTSSNDYHDFFPGDGNCATAEDRMCTLRAAIEEANALPGADTITFAVPTVNLSNQIAITDTVTITGPATINGSGSTRIFEILLPATLSQLTLQNGHIHDTNGGAILNYSSLTVENSIFSNNSTNEGYGGAIHSIGGILTVTGSEFRMNRARYGGAIASTNGAIVDVSMSTFVDNYGGDGDHDGDVFHNEGGTFTVRNASIMASDMSRTGTAVHATGPMILNNITLYNYGLGFFLNRGALLTLYNSAIIGAVDLAVDYGVFDNQYNQTFRGLRDAGLAGLADNGGELLPDGTHPRTFAVQVGSPLIDTGNDATCEPTDERGNARTDVDGVGSAICDVGAFEYLPPAELIFSPYETIIVSEDGLLDSYMVNLSQQPTANVVVTTAPLDTQTLVSNDGATFSNSVTLTFTSANWNIPQTITIQAVDDAIAEGSHSAAVRHSISSGDPNYSGSSDLGISITDNDTAGVALNPASPSLAVSEDGTTDSYTAVLTSQPIESVILSVSPVDTQSEVSGDGVIFAASLDLYFTTANWNVPQTITVKAVDDLYVEGAHSSAISHSVSSENGREPNYNSSMTISNVPVSITDNDGPVGVVFDPAAPSLNVSEAGTLDSYDVTLATPPLDPVTVTVAPADGQINVSDDGITFTTSVDLIFNDTNWNTPQTITVQAVDDTQIEGNHSSTVTHTTTSTDLNYDAIAIGDVPVNITDNDRVPGSLDLNLEETVSAQVAAAGDTVTWTFVITNQVSESSQLVNLTISIPSALTVLDVSTTQGIVTSAAGPTVRVDIGSVAGNGQVVVTVTTQLNGETVAFSAPGVMASLSRQAAGETICVTGNIPGDSATACITVLPDGLPDTGGRPMDGFPWQFFLLAGLLMLGVGVVLLRRKQPLPAE